MNLRNLVISFIASDKSGFQAEVLIEIVPCCDVAALSLHVVRAERAAGCSWIRRFRNQVKYV